jgi:CRISPR-associated protein Csd1
MTILTSLTSAYERLKDAPSFGYSAENIGFLISLNDDGSPAGLPVPFRIPIGKKSVPKSLSVPASFKRPGVTPRSFFLWDNTAFVLGVSADPKKRDCRLRHQAFRDLHLDALKDTDDPGLIALRRFIEDWEPRKFTELGWPEEMKDENVVFALESERSQRMLHERPAARNLWARLSADKEQSQAVCLVTGMTAPIARLHPAIKGVWGAQTSGASIVSFNLDAFESLGHEQGDNAPVSEAAAFSYTTALNEFLKSSSRHRIQIGDASTVFWADASNAEIAEEAESVFGGLFREVDEGVETKKIEAILNKIRLGQPLRDFAPELAEGVRFYVLGLAPNAARLSIRFWLEDDFGVLAERYLRFMDDIRIGPLPRDPYPPLWKYLAETAVQGKRENVPPNLAGEWMRSILTGTDYPLTLLSTVLMRLRSDKTIPAYFDRFALRVAIVKAVLQRNKLWETPVELDRDRKDPKEDTAYLLGRLFAVLERFQELALGKDVNATIRDRYYGSASATPRNVFPVLLRLNIHHQSKAEGNNGRLAGWYMKQLREIMSSLPPDFPAILSLQDQGKFAIGYYHQFNARSENKEHADAKEVSE